MRRLILQPPRTCNCFHLVLAKFCIFDTCDFLRFPPAIGKGKSDALKQRSGHAIFNARTTIGQMPKKQYLCTRNQMRHESSEMASLTKVSSRVRDCSAPSLALALLFSSKLSVCRRGHLPALTGYPSDAAKIGPSGPFRINLRFAATLLRSFLRGCA